MSDLFISRTTRRKSRDQATSFCRCGENNYTMMALMARSPNSHLGETAERRYKYKILRNKGYNMTIALGADKRYAASKSAAK